MRVFVYFNLHRKCLSVKALEGERKGRVIAHADRVMLSDVTFKVSEAGRQRVIREQRKNVHAGVVGTFITSDITHGFMSRIEQLLVPIKYNPYKFDTFVKAVSELPVKTADNAVIASINGRGAIYAKNPSA